MFKENIGIGHFAKPYYERNVAEDRALDNAVLVVDVIEAVLEMNERTRLLGYPEI